MKKKAIGVLAIVLVICVTGIYVGETYAKYTASVSKEGTATVAKWSFSSDNSSTALTINLNGTIDESTLVDDRIAPGTSGSFSIALSNEHSEVGVDFTVAFSGSENVPSNLVLKRGTTVIDPASDTITGTIAAGESTTIPMTWEWAYYTNAADDGEDTTDGVAGAQMTITANVSAVQVQPGAEITTTTFE